MMAIRACGRRASFDIDEDVAAPFVASGARPRVAVLREQGVNSQIEMAAAFHRAGFDAIDVHMTDIIAGRADLDQFKGLVACGGFSYGDVLGAGEGWAKTILFNPRARDQFAAWFAREDSFSLGICNGCQMMAALKDLVPGACALAAFCRQPLGTVRSASVPGRDRSNAVGVLRRDGRVGAADRGVPWRRPGGVYRR